MRIQPYGFYCLDRERNSNEKKHNMENKIINGSESIAGI
jgi:hypothetical protein